jgi:AraC-like DNA-binding protein
MHENTFTLDSDYLAVAVSPALFPNRSQTTHRTLPSVIATAGTAATLALRLLQEAQRPDAFAHIAMQGIAMEIVAEMLRAGERDRSAAHGVAYLRAHILSHYGTPVRVSKVATELGLNAAVLTRQFRAAYGTAPLAFLRATRIAQAAAALREGKTALADIAVRCGFYDQSHFCNVFRRVLGVTPAAYAKSSR